MSAHVLATVKEGRCTAELEGRSDPNFSFSLPLSILTYFALLSTLWQRLGFGGLSES